ncbi:hypothetical protein AKO1_014329 [Acrasis kona]|uniref:Uncharacterized protein n=1 Tax=Acrasis kona TaxID=1008807 RepID=A0AAW2Z101_9EUKA
MYREDIDDLLADIVNNPSSEKLSPYVQKESDRSTLRSEPALQQEQQTKPKRKKKKRSRREENADDEEEIESEEKEIISEEISETQSNPETPLIQYRWGSNLIKDLLVHRLSTVTNNDDFFTNTTQKPINCNSNSEFPRSYPEDTSRTKSTPTSMYIMANFGRIFENEKNLNTGVDRWEGEEYVLCIIRAMPDGSFVMKPGLSLLTDPSANQQEQNNNQKEEQIRFNESLLQTKEKSFMFRTEDGNVYEYTIHLHNDNPINEEKMLLRRQLMNTINDRAVSMRNNLIGSDFVMLSNENHCRIHVFGKISYGLDFDCNDAIFVKFTLKMPDHQHEVDSDFISQFKLQDASQTKITSSTQASFPLVTLNYQIRSKVNYDFPFEFHFSSHVQTNHNHLHHHKPKLLFEVISVDGWGRRRVIGYGRYTLPTDPYYCQGVRVPTWKPKGSIRQNLRDFYLGGGPELEDVTYVDVPTGHKDKILNKFGFLSEPSGTLVLDVQTIVQRKKTNQNLWQFGRIKPSLLDINRVEDAIKKNAMIKAEEERRRQEELEEEARRLEEELEALNALKADIEQDGLVDEEDVLQQQQGYQDEEMVDDDIDLPHEIPEQEEHSQVIGELLSPIPEMEVEEQQEERVETHGRQGRRGRRRRNQQVDGEDIDY